MTNQNLDPLSLYAGLNITYPATGGIGTSMNKAISCFFDKAENALAHLQPKSNRAIPQTQQTKNVKEAIY